MMIDELKKAKITAMKEKNADARSVLDVVITKIQLGTVEARSKGQEFTDAQCLEVIQKVIKELEDEKAGFEKVGNADRVASLENQKAVIKAYLPAQLSKEEILEEINKLDDKSMPSIMKHFKANFAGKVDMSLVSQVARSL